MKQLNNYKLNLTKWKLPYFKKYVRGEITYKEYNPSVSDFCHNVQKIVPLLYTVAMAEAVCKIYRESLK